MTAPAELARKCFALARSTEHAGEREAAIGRGMAILERHGLDPDRFYIPGRVRPADDRAPGVRAWATSVTSVDALRESLQRMHDQMESAKHRTSDVARERMRAAMRGNVGRRSTFAVDAGS